MGLRVVPVLHCVRLALRVVLSWFGNAIDSGTGKPGAVTGCPEWHHPGGGQRTGEGAAGSGLSSPKFQKEQKDPFSLRH